MEDESEELIGLFKQKRRLIAKNNLQELSKVCNRLGELLSLQGHFKDALTEHQAEEAACVAVNDVIGIAVACRKIGECYAELGYFDEAIDHQNKHLELAREVKSCIEEQRALATIGRTHFYRAEALRNRLKRNDNQDSSVTEALNLAEDAFYKSLDICDRLPTCEIGRSELVQMKGRLYLNLGLVMDQRHNLESCVNFISKAITLHEEHCQWEDLERSHHSLALTCRKHGDFENCLNHAEAAFEAAVKLKDVKLQCEALILIGQVSMERNNFSNAKKAFRKARKLDMNENNVVHLLKCAAKLQQTKDAICMMGSDDKESKLKAYEKMGDLCSKASTFKSAVEFYELALRYAEKLEKPKEELAPLYVSMAETHKDLRQYKNAAQYYRLEMKCWEGNPEEKCRTLLNLADCEEEMGADYLNMESMHTEALALAKGTGKRNLEKLCLESLAALQDSFGEVEKRRTTLQALSDINADAGSEDDEASSQHSSNSSVLLSDSTESEDDAEVVKVNQPVRCQKTRKRFRLRKNEKGETPLHRACITGDLKQAKRLIEQGHPVNIRDYSGWLPLHEAANNDFPEIVQLLLENGAWLNDRGGSHCDGITPLHDAASCGNFEIVRILLRHGASILAKTDKNDTVLDCLLAWRKRIQNIDPELSDDYVRLEEELRSRLGQSWTHDKMDDPAGSERRRERRNEGQERPDYRRNADRNSTERKPRVLTSLPSKEMYDDSGPALVEESEILPDCDDWLIDDMGNRRQRDSKRRRCDILSWMEGASNARRTSSSLTRVSSSSRLEVHGFRQEGQQDKERKRRRTHSSGTVGQSYAEDAVLSPGPFLSEEHDRNASEVPVPPPALPVLLVKKVKVKILEKLFLIVVPQGETISWLAKEASQRYFNETGLRPNLSLSTLEGALFSPDDTVDVVLSQNEEVLGTMQSWDLSSLSQRYVDSCKTLKMEPKGNIHRILLHAETSMVASLSNLNLTPTFLSPIARALQCQFNLQELNLSGNQLGKQGLKTLALALQRLPGLCILDISLNDITDSELGEIVQPLASHKDVIKLETLNLGFNPLLEEGCFNLTALLRSLPNLINLSIPSISSSLNKCFPVPHLHEALEVVRKIERLDLSFTRLPFVQLDSLLASVCLESVRHLNLTAVVAHPSQALEMCKTLSELLRKQLCALQELYLSLCSLTDKCITALLPGLADKRNLVHLDISGNAELTEASLNAISKMIPKNRINVSSCPNISPAVTTETQLLPHLVKPTVLSGHLKTEEAILNFGSDEDCFQYESMVF